MMNAYRSGNKQQAVEVFGDYVFGPDWKSVVERTIPDEYEYTVTVEAGNTHHTIHTSDSTAPQSLRPLLETLTKLSRGSTSPVSEE